MTDLNLAAGGCRRCGVEQPWPTRLGFLCDGFVCACTDEEAGTSCPSGPLPPGDGTGGVKDVSLCW
jgi:hypothetical protein